MVRLGVLGFSEGNGHPFSFSAIVNGYDDAAFATIGWGGIHDYLRKRGPEEFGFDGVAVTHCWMPDRAMAEGLSRACRVAHVVDAPEAMIGQVDAALILRDDPESHWKLARPFLESGAAVFVDKPLTTDAAELARFEPYLRSGRLMSCAGLRFARELDELRDPAALAGLGPLSVIECSVLNDWTKYGIHMLEAVQGLTGALPVSVQRLPGRADHLAVLFEDGLLASIHCVGASPKLFEVTLRGRGAMRRIDLHDNFSAFRRVLGAFIGQLRSGTPAIAPEVTLAVIRSIQAGLAATPGGPPIAITRESRA